MLCEIVENTVQKSQYDISCFMTSCTHVLQRLFKGCLKVKMDTQKVHEMWLWWHGIILLTAMHLYYIDKTKNFAVISSAKWFSRNLIPKVLFININVI